MSHVRFPRAAVAVAAASPIRSADTPRREAPRSASPALVLWASTALVVKDGSRLVAVRRSESLVVEVGWIAPGASNLRWRSASEVLSDAEERRWLRIARFSK